MLAPDPVLPPEFRPLRVEEYHQLIELGVFEGTHVELVGGVLVEMSPQGPEHFGLIPYLNHLFVRLVGEDYVVSPQGPVIADEISEPEPDFAILSRRDTRRTGKPTDALLVVEVSNSSLRFDLGEKARRYAGAGYPEYWVIDVQARTIHVHREPRPDGTWGQITIQADGPLTAVAVPPITIDVTDLLDF
ncbi:Uma2 family endonuclease [soil metagenome]